VSFSTSQLPPQLASRCLLYSHRHFSCSRRCSSGRATASPAASSAHATTFQFQPPMPPLATVGAQFQPSLPSFRSYRRPVPTAAVPQSIASTMPRRYPRTLQRCPRRLDDSLGQFSRRPRRLTTRHALALALRCLKNYA
jgi:hypothetical protein